MASIKHHPKSPFWMACFSLPDGRRTTRSTATTDRKEAQRIANHFEDAALEGKLRRLTESRARKTIADIYALANQDILPSSTTHDFLDSWLKRKALEAGETTHVRYATVVEQFKEFLGMRAHQDITHLGVREITTFRDYQVRRLAPGTVNVSLKILRSALAQARRDGLIDVNPAERVTLLKVPKGARRRPFTIAELRALLAVADPEWRGMILFGVYTGLRLGDIARLTWRNIDLEQGDLSVTTAKTKREQVLPLAKTLLGHLAAMRAGVDSDGPLFLCAYGAKQRSEYGGTLSNQFYQILVEAGLAEPRSHLSCGKGRGGRRAPSVLSFHSLRHTATSFLKNAGVSDAVARDIIGHESAAVSANYTHIDQRTKREALEKLPDLLGSPADVSTGLTSGGLGTE
jgi:integrase